MRRIRIEWVNRFARGSGLYGFGISDGITDGRLTFYLYRDNIHDHAVRKDLTQDIRRWVRGPMWQREQAEIAAEKIHPSCYQI